MKKPAIVEPTDEVTHIGTFFETPVVVKGITWLPLAEVLVWGFTSWLAGRRRPERSFTERVGVGALTMPILLGLEWCHNFAHAAAASLIGKPMDALRITWGTPLAVYYDINDPTVTPRQHILRASGGPVFNAILLPVAMFLRQQTHPDSIKRELADVAVGMNAFLCTISLLPIPGIDGGPILKWSLVERGREPDEADQVVQKINGVLGAILGIGSVLAFRKKRTLLGVLIAPFATIMLAIGSGLIREQ